MSLLKTLARVAIGVAIAKGVGSVMQAKRGGGAATGGSGAGTGGLFGGAQSPGRATNMGGGAPGGLQDIMAEVLGGKPGAHTGTARAGGAAQTDGGMGGLGGLLEQLAGGAAGGAAAGRGQAGGLDGILGQLSKGGLGGLLGGLAGGAMAGGAMGGGAAAGDTAPAPAPQEASFGELLNQSLKNFGEPDVPPAPHQEAAAGLMLRAMIQAAKADGKIDEGERAKLLDSLHDATEAEMTFVKTELAAPVDIEGLVAQVPKGLEAQIYTMSVMAITLDNQTEAQYLNALATALGLDHAQVNDVHTKLGVPTLYA